jgi:hypothetical protein
MTNKDIIKQYVDTGCQITEYQLNKLPVNLVKTYLRKRMLGFIDIAEDIINNDGTLDFLYDADLEQYEIDKLSKEQTILFWGWRDQIPGEFDEDFNDDDDDENTENIDDE